MSRFSETVTGARRAAGPGRHWCYWIRAKVKHLKYVTAAGPSDLILLLDLLRPAGTQSFMVSCRVAGLHLLTGVDLTAV